MTLEIPYCFSQEGARPLISLTRSAVALLVWPPVGMIWTKASEPSRLGVARATRSTPSSLPIFSLKVLTRPMGSWLCTMSASTAIGAL